MHASEPSFDGGVALVSPAGWGNLGDAAILDSVIHAVRLRLPAAPLVALTLNPEDTEARHGIPAFTCTGFSRPHYGVRQASASAPEADAAPSRGAFGRVLSVPGIRHVGSLLRAVERDRRHRSDLARPLERLRHIVVAGGGQLDEFWGGALGHPYVLYRWARHAQRTGARYLVLSVGTGSLASKVARGFVERALDIADYRSFRDEGSRELVGGRHAAGAPVVPDLAYGLPVKGLRRAAEPARARPLIGISPIAYCDPRVWPLADERRYRSYLERLAEFCRALVELGFELVLFATDGPDQASIDDLTALLAPRLSSEAAPRVRTTRIRTHQELFETVAEASAIVASRLHGVLLCQLLGLPVLAFSYERKVQTLMRSLEHAHYSLDIDAFEPVLAVARFRELFAARRELTRAIIDHVDARARAVAAQYDVVFGAAPSTLRARADLLYDGVAASPRMFW